ncbi:S-adenosylmethionine-dependent methyltransferase Rv2258c-like isoform X2 [Antedon mediterranea]
MTSAGIVKIDPENEKYYLPENHRKFFDKSKSESYIVQYMELLPTLCTLREKVAKCYPIDGPKGVSPEQYKCFASHMSKVSAVYVNRQLLSYINQVDGLTHMLESGVECLDLACGTGHTTVIMAERFLHSKFIGGDFMAEQLSVGRDIANSRNLTNITLQQFNVENLPQEWTERFDFVLCHYAIHDLSNPKKGLKEFRRVLKTSGIGLIADVNMHSKHSGNVNNHVASMEYGFSEVHCMPASLSFDDGWGLGAGWGVEYATQFIESCGFEVKMIESGKTVLYIVKTK